MNKIIYYNTLPGFLNYFKEDRDCVDFLTVQRWKGKIRCPFCTYDKVYITNRGYKCANPSCHKKFSVTSGTIFENTKISLRLWFGAMYLCTQSGGITSTQLARDLEITQKSAWYLLQRIRILLEREIPLNSLDIPARLLCRLNRLNIRSIRDLENKNRSFFFKARNFGVVILNDLDEFVKRYNIALAKKN